MAQGRSGTGPFSKHRKGTDYGMLSARLHKTDIEHLKSRLTSEGITYCEFVRAIVEEYLHGDVQLIRIIADWKKRNVLPPSRKERDLVTFSPAELRKIEIMMHSAGHDDDGEG